jgi:hypothetical protein
MKKWLFPNVLMLLFIFAGVPYVLAGDTLCSGNMGAVTVSGNLVVCDSCQCVLTGTTIKGSIIVKSGGRLVAEGIRVSGSIMASGADQIQLLNGSLISSNVSITGTTGAEPSMISDSEIRGNLELNQNLSKFEVGQNTISANLRLEENTGKIDARGNIVSGNLVMMKNTGGIIAKENQIKGSLTCKDNDPAPRGGDNIVSGQIKGQCAAMEPEIVSVPNIVGLIQADAGAIIEGAYLNIGAITTAYDSAVPLDHVISQNPPAGTMVETDTPVDLIVCFQSGPMITFAANPQTIMCGQSSTLSWTVEHADSVSIDQGIGSVALTGSIKVSPSQTTTYTLTATGTPAIKEITVTVIPIPAPIATFSANPETILVGESSTLSWTTQNADRVIIEPDIGAVGLNGSIMVSPSQTMTYTLTATGPGGTCSPSVTITVSSSISIQITSPANGDTISGKDVTVKGIIANSTENDTGVIVNHMPATVYDGKFFMNRLPLREGENTITVVAIDSSGAQVTQDILVNSILPSHYIRLIATSESGLAPMETELHVRGSFSLISPAVIHSSGPGPVTFIENGIDQFKISLTAAGIYHITATATDSTGNLFTDTIMLLAMDRGIMDALLSAKWNGMMDSLSRGDATAASQYFSSNIRAKYASNFDLLRDHLSEIAFGLQDLRLLKITENEAEYSVIGNQAGRKFSFYVLFVRDMDGIWRIRFF